MAYSQFTIPELEKRFGLEIVPAWDLFDKLPSQPISDWLAKALAEGVPLALAIATEKAKSECIVAPMLIEFGILKSMVEKPETSITNLPT